MRTTKFKSTGLVLGAALFLASMMNAQSKPDDASAQPAQTQTAHEDRGFDWGWLGLLGLAGLAGLRHREPTHSGRLASESR